MRKARVFISCGQSTEREKQIGLSIESYFKNDRKFETYFAEIVHSSEALTENIFSFIRESEYFIFIDFKRERIRLLPCEYRGSLFVNQEIAIATFLKLKGFGFYEEGVKREGILSYQIFNAFPFKKGDEILNILKQETRDWDNESVNELYLSYDPETTTKNVSLNDAPERSPSDWYHLIVKNRNKRKHAFSCTGYVTKIINANSGKIISIPTNELIWAGTGDISVNIMADNKRELDALYVGHNTNFIFFHQRPLYTTNPRYCLPDLQKGEYRITYTVISSNFPVASKEFSVIYSGSHENIIFEE